MATLETTETPGEGAGDGVRRRDFINLAAVSFAGVGAATVLLPLINQMNPSADVLALASIEVDISAIKEGQAIKTIFRKQPLFVRHLTGAEIAAADKVDPSTLRDPQTLEPAKARSGASSAAISARATVRPTTPRRASAKARRRRISKCRNTPSNPIPSSKSAEVDRHELPLGKSLRA
jgi:hypothetical protein